MLTSKKKNDFSFFICIYRYTNVFKLKLRERVSERKKRIIFDYISLYIYIYIYILLYYAYTKRKKLK